jgi:NAD-dependent deacetylase
MTDTDAQYDDARTILNAARHVAIFTGSGISADAGIPTYRGIDGLWEGEPVEKVAHPDGFAADPVGVWEWYNARRATLGAIGPAEGHLALARLDATLTAQGGSVTVCTQNIDGLHTLAGSKVVHELHGSMLRARCCDCDYRCELTPEPVTPLPPECPACGSMLRPAVVWFTESLPQDVLSAAADAVTRCDTFLTIGTSAVVFPAAGLIDLAIQTGARTIEVNLDPTDYSSRVDISLRGRAAEILPNLID